MLAASAEQEPGPPRRAGPASPVTPGRRRVGRLQRFVRRPGVWLYMFYAQLFVDFRFSRADSGYLLSSGTSEGDGWAECVCLRSGQPVTKACLSQSSDLRPFDRPRERWGRALGASIKREISRADDRPYLVRMCAKERLCSSIVGVVDVTAVVGGGTFHGARSRSRTGRQLSSSAPAAQRNSPEIRAHPGP